MKRARGQNVAMFLRYFQQTSWLIAKLPTYKSAKKKWNYLILTLFFKSKFSDSYSSVRRLFSSCNSTKAFDTWNKQKVKINAVQKKNTPIVKHTTVPLAFLLR